jgi:hypothetical protein
MTHPPVRLAGRRFAHLDRRPELAAALADARRLKCPIIVAKLMRREIITAIKKGRFSPPGGAAILPASRPRSRRPDCAKRPDLS